MMCLTKTLGATLAIALVAGSVTAADTVAGGKVKSINADNKTFVLTDAAAKDATFKFGDDLVVNRAGKEGKSDLKAGDAINVCYDKGLLTSTAHYILVQEGASKNSTLIRGTVKGYDAAKKEVTITDELKKDTTYSMGNAMVRLNMGNTTIADVKIGDHVLFIVDTNAAGKTTLQSVMVERAK